MQYKTQNLRKATQWLDEGKKMFKYFPDGSIGVIRLDPNLRATLLETDYNKDGTLAMEFLNPTIHSTSLELCVFYDEMDEIEFFKKKSLHLEVGKYYATSNGDLVKITDKTNQQGEIRFRGCIFGYQWIRTFLENGACLRSTNNKDERFDLVKEVSLKIEEVK